MTRTADQKATSADRRGPDLWNLAQTATAAVAGLAAFVYLLGQIVTRVRLSAAHVPVDAALATTSQASFFGTGLQSALLMAVAFAGTSVVAFVLAGWRLPSQAGAFKRGAWSENRDAWYRLIVGRLGPPESELDPKLVSVAVRRERLVRVVAGYDVLVLAGVLALVVATLLGGAAELAYPRYAHAEALIFWAVLLVLAPTLAWVGPRPFLRLSGPIAFFIVAAVALVALAPVGLLVLAGVATAASGRFVARRELRDSPTALLTSPYPFLLMAIFTLVAVARVAIPPVPFPHAVIATSGGPQSGGYLTRTSDGVALVVCTPLPDGTSFGQHVVFIESKDIRGTTLAGGNYQLDNGDRPSLLTIALNAIGFNPHLHALLPRSRFRPTQPACTTGTPSRQIATVNAALGPGVLVGPASGAQSEFGEPPIEATTQDLAMAVAHNPDPPMRIKAAAAGLATLARRWEPTVEVAVADRFWPVSVGAVLQERAPSGASTCLSRKALGCSSLAGSSLSSLSLGRPPSSPGDYLRYPISLSPDPTGHFEAFMRGQLGSGRQVPTQQQWETDPGLIDPWATAQVYFYYAANTNPATWSAPNPGIVGDFIALQYWFFFPYHYIPTVVAPALMTDAPLAGDEVNTDLHEGDWQHVTVLVDAKSRKPIWLYMARHSAEGQYYPWTSPALTFDGTHPIIDFSYGAHAPYDNNCGQRPRVGPALGAISGRVSDWIVCGSGRFAFRGGTTPLVDLAQVPWACWPGRFGVAVPMLSQAVRASGPRSPLWQAENGRLAVDSTVLSGRPQPIDHGVCANRGNPAAPEIAAIRTLTLPGSEDSRSKPK